MGDTDTEACKSSLAEITEGLTPLARWTVILKVLLALEESPSHCGTQDDSSTVRSLAEKLAKVPRESALEALAPFLGWTPDLPDPEKDGAVSEASQLLGISWRVLIKLLDVPASLAGDTAGAQDEEARTFTSTAFSRLQILHLLLLNPLARTAVDEEEDLQLRTLLVCSSYADAGLRWTTPQQQSVAEITASALATLKHQSLSQLVGQHLGEVLPKLQAAVKSSDKQADETQLVPARPASLGTSIFAATRLLWLLSQMTFPSLGPHWHLILPCVLSSLDHYSLQVRLPGLKAMRHLVKNLTITELRWFADVAMDAVCKQIAGCEEEIWPEVLPTLVGLTVQIEGRNPRGKWYSHVLALLTQEGERNCDSVFRRGIWLRHISPLLENLGLLLVGHFKRLMPLLMFWLHTQDEGTRLLTLDVLLVVVRNTWPRIPVHAPRLEAEVSKLLIETRGGPAEGELKAKAEAIMEAIHWACEGRSSMQSPVEGSHATAVVTV